MSNDQLFFTPFPYGEINFTKMNNSGDCYDNSNNSYDSSNNCYDKPNHAYSRSRNTKNRHKKRECMTTQGDQFLCSYDMKMVFIFIIVVIFALIIFCNRMSNQVDELKDLIKELTLINRMQNIK